MKCAEKIVENEKKKVRAETGITAQESGHVERFKESITRERDTSTDTD